jgi:two-component system sensor histidine kinase BaeS
MMTHGDDPSRWGERDWRAARESWRRRRMAEGAGYHRGGPPWMLVRGFGCLFALLFLVIAGSVVAASAFVLASLGPIPGLIALGVVVVLLGWMGRTLLMTGRALDRLVEATRRVEAGDYSVRVQPAAGRASGPRLVDELNIGFDTMATRLETDERQRRTLLAEISHELRTPLTVVQGNLEAIMDGVYQPDAGHIGLILDETRVLGRLIDDLRTLALSEAGTLTLHPEPTDPDLLVAEVVRSFEPTASAAGITLGVSIDGDLPITDLDPVRIREVLGNLVANAIGHTPAGGRVTIVGGVDPGDWIRLEVRDTGVGIDPELLPHVFDRFVKDDASRGSGLGMAIARQLVAAHDGDIEAESRPGEGTTIRIRLPIRDA